MGIFQKLFGKQGVSIDELREALKEVERDRRRNRREISRWERQRKKIVDRMKKQRQDGSQLEVDYSWDEFKHHRVEGADLRRQGRVYNLEGIALRRTLRAVERLEKKADRGGVQDLLRRIQATGVTERAAIDREMELQQLQDMNAMLDEFTGDLEQEPEDPEKLLFLAELDNITNAEQAGDEEVAAEREAQLLEEFDRDPEAE
ncbi:MAG: hypothetical protein AAF581_16165 [Planctomycetota bacterium]